MTSHVEAVPREDRIRAIAHALWIEEGCPDGRADQHWERAVSIADAEEQPGEKSEKPKRKATPRKTKTKA